VRIEVLKQTYFHAPYIYSNLTSILFYSSKGEMRVWSGARSAVEIKRDMCMDVSGKDQYNIF
jgi:hypothetical protein